MEYKTTLATNEPIAITIGNFDGVHKGHQRLMHQLIARARDLNCVPVMVTFSPHTLAVVRPHISLEYLTTLEEKLALSRAYGELAHSIVISFTPQVAAMTAQEFMDSLRARFKIRGLVVGADFSLGHKRMGDVAFLEAYGQAHGMLVQAISLEEIASTRISSTRIRSFVSKGDIATANELLGHSFLFTGPVIHGEKRGRALGFPTANLLPLPQKLLPASGVYAVRVHVHEGQESDWQHDHTVYTGVANVGIRPTFDGQTRLLEVHMLDVDLDLYEKHLTVEFIAHLRSEQRFPSVDALKTQIARDVEKARQILAIGG